MKNFITLSLLLLFVVSASAKDLLLPQDTIIRTVVTTTKTDSITGKTVTTTTETEKIVPTVYDSQSRVISDGASYGIIFSWEKKKKKRLHPHWTGIGMGFMNYDNVPYGGLKVSKSHNFTVNLIDFYKRIGSSNFLVISGIGTEWSRYHFDENAALTKRDGYTVFEPAPEGVHYKSSKMLAYYITIPLLLEYQIPHFHISGGPVVFFKHYSKSQIKYYDGDNKIVRNMGRDLNMRPVDLKLRLQVGIDNVGIYGYYSPLSMFEKDKGPDVNTYTIGLMLGI